MTMVIIISNQSGKMFGGMPPVRYAIRIVKRGKNSEKKRKNSFMAQKNKNL